MDDMKPCRTCGANSRRAAISDDGLCGACSGNGDGAPRASSGGASGTASRFVRFGYLVLDVWVEYRNARGERVPAVFAEPGALVYADVQVIKLQGRVRFQVSQEDANYYGLTIEELKSVIDESFVPIQVKKKAA